MKGLAEELHARREKAKLGGGEEKIDKQHEPASSPPASASTC